MGAGPTTYETHTLKPVPGRATVDTPKLPCWRSQLMRRIEMRIYVLDVTKMYLRVRNLIDASVFMLKSLLLLRQSPKRLWRAQYT
jgi:hypothetical protein